VIQVQLATTSASDTSIDESSELVEVSVQGPLGVTEDYVSVGDSEEWEDVW
jgi:hypothetical protein